MQARVLNANLIQALRQKKLFGKEDHVLVAVSGGEDSLNLLRWLTDGRLPDDLQPTISAAYVNHQLRSDAAEEEAFVERVFQETPQLASGHMRRLTWDSQPTHSIEELAREGRYTLLAEIAREIGATVIVTAHHQDDQAETVLYKLIRGSRLSQLSGMSENTAFTENIRLVRPFLGLTKENMRTLNNHNVQEWVVDSSNEDVTFARNRLRHEILPGMKEVNTQVNEHLVRLGDQLAGQRALLAPFLANYVAEIEEGTFNWQLPVESCILVLQHWLTEIAVFDISDKQLGQVVQLMRNQNTNRGEVMLRNGRRFVRKGPYLRIESDKHNV